MSRPPSRRRWVVGVDVGGTFTDAVAVAGDGRSVAVKVPSTPRDPAQALVDALGELIGQGIEPGAVSLLVHGTTIATNAVIEGRLARVALATTTGFRDLLEVRSGTRRDVYDLWAAKPKPVVASANRVEVDERMGPDGHAPRPLSDGEVRRVAAAIAARRPESVAVALLFSYANPSHEQRIGSALRDRLPGLPVTLSSDVAPEFREYPRVRTTVVAAALKPMVGTYLERAQGLVEDVGVEAPLLVMLSGGGTVRASRAGQVPHHLINSGPAGGVAGALAVGLRCGRPDLISLDMGGTSTDVCLVRDGVPPSTAGQTLDGEPLLAPSVDLVSAGAGGGSIARMEAGTSLRVGPRSAGADPGPASYGRGGTDPTVTDAHLLVGDLASDYPLAGRLPLDPDLAERAFAPLARTLGRSPERAASAVLALADAHVARTVRRVSTERGHDPRGMTLVAFGGAGPMHAAGLMRELGLGQVLVPLRPGVTSAAGLLAADLRADRSQTVLLRFDRSAPVAMVGWFRDAARELVARMRGDDIAAHRVRLVASADCRYLGQGFELPVPLGGLSVADLRGLGPRFHDLHRRTYGHAAPDEVIEVVTLRLAAYGGLSRPPGADLPAGRADHRPQDGARAEDRSVLLPGASTRRRVPVWHRDALRAGDRLVGPCLVEQLDATTLVLERMRADVLPGGELRIAEAS